MLKSMETIALEYETKRLDHLGIVAGICKQIDLVNMIDGLLPTPSERRVSCGQANTGNGNERAGADRSRLILDARIHEEQTD